MGFDLKTTLIYLILVFLLSSSSLNTQAQEANHSNYQTKLNLTEEQEKIQRIFNEFVIAVDEDPKDYTLSVVESEQINAYASMGNNIVVNTALIEFLENDTALAFVIAHELGHLEENHVWKSITRQSLSSLLGYYVFGGNRLLHGVDRLHSLHYSRSKEKEADIFAVNLMNKLYCQKPGKLEFFETMAAQDQSPKILEYVSTHPLASSRLEYLKEKIRADNCLI